MKEDQVRLSAQFHQVTHAALDVLEIGGIETREVNLAAGFLYVSVSSRFDAVLHVPLWEHKEADYVKRIPF
jgi:hypothetical protein